ncbi:MAG: DUF4240 domain-containing protein [Planctomycetaceae bacterium]
MTEEQFWSLIQASHDVAKGQVQRQELSLRKALVRLSAEQIVEFDHWFQHFVCRAYRWDLWGAAFVICDGCSDDGFLDFRHWLVAQGQSIYAKALNNPESLASAIDPPAKKVRSSGLSFLNPAMFAWAESLGKEESELDDFPNTTDGPGDPNPIGEPFDEDQESLRKRYPKLWSMFH